MKSSINFRVDESRIWSEWDMTFRHWNTLLCRKSNQPTLPGHLRTSQIQGISVGLKLSRQYFLLSYFLHTLRQSIHSVWIKFTHKFINLALSFLSGYTGYNIKNGHTSVPKPYEFLAKKKYRKTSYEWNTLIWDKTF